MAATKKNQKKPFLTKVVSPETRLKTKLPKPKATHRSLSLYISSNWGGPVGRRTLSTANIWEFRKNLKTIDRAASVVLAFRKPLHKSTTITSLNVRIRIVVQEVFIVIIRWTKIQHMILEKILITLIRWKINS